MDTIDLGGNIQLNGFSSLDGGQMIVLKKIIGNYTKRLNTICTDFEQIVFTLNSQEEGNYFVDASLLNGGKKISAETMHKNLFMAVDLVLKEIESKI